MSELTPTQYDQMWSQLGDFIRHNPGARHRRRLVWNVLNGLEFETFADIGCGRGEFIRMLAQRRPDLRRMVGTDFAEETLGAVRRALPSAEFFTLDIARECLHEAFDVVLCSEVIEHVSQQKEVIKNLSAMVRPAGHLIVTCPTGRMFATEVAFGHVRHPTARDLQTWGEAAGLETVQSYCWGWPTYSLLKYATNINPGFANRQFASGSYSRFKIALNDMLYWITALSLPKSPYGCQLVWHYKKTTTRLGPCP